MKKLFFVLSLVLGISVTASAQENRGFFDRGVAQDGGTETTITPGLPSHGQSTNQPAPLGSGALLLIGLGAAYALKKKKD